MILPLDLTIIPGFHMSQNNLTDAQIVKLRIGMIVKSNGNIIGSGSSLSEALPEVEPTTTQKDKAVMGVYTHISPPDRWRDMDNSKGAIFYNSIGEGRVLVTDTNGNIETVITYVRLTEKDMVKSKTMIYYITIQ